MYLAVDGGGSKLAAVLYTDDLRWVCSARSGGVNFTQNSEKDVLLHIRECIRQLEPHLPAELEGVDEVFVGGRNLFEAELRAHVGVKAIRVIGEPEAGLLAGACRQDGLLALSGTGSDVFLIENGKVVSAVGGWGPIMGDQGSGAWIGLQAMRAVCRHVNGWGEDTLLTELMCEHFQIPRSKLPPEAINRSPSPYAVAASLVPLTAKAAYAGDSVALDIFERAGRAMGVQMEALLKRVGRIPCHEIVLCGGAWKAHPKMKESCLSHMRGLDEGFDLLPPCFEHVLAGPALRLLERGMSEERAKRVLAEQFPDMIINRGGIPA